MTKITRDNYYTSENECISNSKVSDFLKSKEYYLKKHILRTIVEEPTDAMKLGQMVDCAVSSGDIGEMRKKYVVKVLKKDDPEGYAEQKNMSPEFLVTEALMEKAVEMSEAVMREPFYKWYKEVKTTWQQPLIGQIVDGARIIPVCGMPDAIATAENGTFYIDDLKTSALSHLRSPETWYWHCRDMGYLRQQAIYKYLLQQQFPSAKIICRHIVISSQKNGRYAIKLFATPDELLVPAFYDFGVAAISIVTEKDNPHAWEDEPITWSSAVMLSEPRDKKAAAAVDEE